MLRAFLGGPITHMLSDSGFESSGEIIFRRAADLLVSRGYELFSAHLLEDFGRIVKETDIILVQRDLAWITNSDFCVFIIPTGHDGKPVQTDGSYIEIGFALALHKNISIFWNDSAADYYSPMLRGICSLGVTFYPLDQMEEVLADIGKCTDKMSSTYRK